MFHYPASNTVQEQRQYFNMAVKSMSIDFGRSYALNFVKHLPALCIALLFMQLFLADDRTLHNIFHILFRCSSRNLSKPTSFQEEVLHILKVSRGKTASALPLTHQGSLPGSSPVLNRSISCRQPWQPIVPASHLRLKCKKKNALRKISKRFLKVGDYLFSRAVSS